MCAYTHTGARALVFCYNKCWPTFSASHHLPAAGSCTDSSTVLHTKSKSLKCDCLKLDVEKVRAATGICCQKTCGRGCFLWLSFGLFPGRCWSAANKKIFLHTSLSLRSKNIKSRKLKKFWWHLCQYWCLWRWWKITKTLNRRKKRWIIWN